ncbi:MAG: nucleotide exchange factor GrpE [Candidatus Sumerlaeia bacterium]|nr:nucleotide exchange factor GrpE [Candidatus Sumerlaeia bacterium]
MWPFSELEFVVDEKPVAVTVPKRPAAEREAGDDLLGQISWLLAENERLTVTTRMLEQARGESDEMFNLMKRMLPVLDGFERTLAMGRTFPDDPTLTNWLRSVESVYFRLKNLLEKIGLFGMEDIGKPVNLDLHEVVEYRYSPDHKPDTIMAIRQRGYVFRGRLLREAQVVVASNERR